MAQVVVRRPARSVPLFAGPLAPTIWPLGDPAVKFPLSI
jgi:hypothetical protein